MAREFDSLQAFIDADDQPIFVLDAELRYTAFNRAHAAAMRALYGAEITVGGRLTDYQTVAADREAAQANLERALAGERVVAGAFSGEPGRERFFEVAHVPLLDAAGVVVGVGTQASDATERKQAEDTARASEALYRSILDASPDAVTLVDLEGSVRTASRAALPMFGYEREDDVAGRPLMEFLVPEDRARAKAAIARLLHGDHWGPQEYRGLRADGSNFPVEARGELVCDADGRAVSMVFSVRDVTERKRIHDALELSEAKFATAFRTSPDAINLNRVSDGLYLDISDGFTEITGFTRDDVQGRTSTELAIWVGPEGREQIVKALQADRVVRGLEMRFRRKNGSLGTGLMSARVIDVDGEPCILSTTRDITESKQMEAALRESEAHFAALFNEAPVGYQSLDDTGCFIDVNAAWTETLGYAREEVIGRWFGDLLAPEYVEPFQERFPLFKERGTTHSEFEMVRKDGERRFIAFEGRIAHKPDGAFKQTVCVLADVTERVRAVAALTASEAKWRRILKHSPQIGVSIDRQRRIVFANRHFLELTGWTEEEVLGQDWFELCVPAPFRAQVRSVFDTVMSQHAITGFSNYENEILTKSGETRNVAWSNVITTDALGAAVDVTSLGVDVTERLRADAALRESEQRYRTVADNTYDWEWWAAPDGGYLYVSPSCERISGHSAQEFLAEPELLYTITHRDDVAKLRAHMEAGAAHLPQAHHLEFRITTPSGEERWIEHLCREVVDAHGAHLGHRGSHRDITERKQAEDEIRRLNAELEERVVSRTAELAAANSELESFAYSISHDLRAPLRAIDGFSQMVFEDAADKLDVDDLEHLQRVRAGAQRMAVLIDEMLSLSRAGRVDMLMEDVDLSALAAEVLAELREAQPERRVETIVAPGLRVRADAVLLRAILANLLSNAWKFTSGHETARIEVGTAGTNGGQAYFVRDDGAGFDSRNAKHLFGAFQRMHHTVEFEGDGIGLAIVQRLVTRHGGRVWAEAEVEKGAIFFFTLPGKGSFTDG